MDLVPNVQDEVLDDLFPRSQPAADAALLSKSRRAGPAAVQALFLLAQCRSETSIVSHRARSGSGRPLYQWTIHVYPGAGIDGAFLQQQHGNHWAVDDLNIDARYNMVLASKEVNVEELQGVSTVDVIPLHVPYAQRGTECRADGAVVGLSAVAAEVGDQVHLVGGSSKGW